MPRNASGDGIDEWANSGSQLSMLLYLNGPEDGVQGGATRVFGCGGQVLDVTPKYVARINVLYDLDA